MSQNLYWRPAFNDGKSLCDQLKYILRERNLSNYRFTPSDIPYLEGLMDAGIKDANELIKAINKHELVDVYEE